MSSGTQAHWNVSYESKSTGEVSWFEAAPILDVGGGASRLANELIGRGYRDVTVADISSAALQAARTDYGTAAERVQWVEADVRTHDFGRQFDLWRDRAVFHFMVDDADRASHLATLRRSLNPGGHLVLATFGPKGPTRCSALPVQRYGVEEMSEQLGEEFELLADAIRLHTFSLAGSMTRPISGTLSAPPGSVGGISHDPVCRGSGNCDAGESTSKFPGS